MSWALRECLPDRVCPADIAGRADHTQSADQKARSQGRKRRYGVNNWKTSRLESRFKNSLECSMTESEFLALADATLAHIETVLEEISDSGEVDVECGRSGNVLEIEFVDNGSKIIINSQAPLQEMW